MLHHADHELENLRIFCPQHYFHGCLTTWNTPQLFLPLPDLTDQQLHQQLTQSFPANIRRAYPRGFRKHFYTPHGVVFLKQKKSWRKGRTVISYFRSIAGTLLRATSKALDIMLLHLLPQHPGQLSIPNLWQHLHNHLQTTPEDIHLTPINDDLVGFFNSVPQQRLVDAVISLCNRWKAQHTTTTITIDVQSTGNPIQHSHIGRHYIHHPQQRTLDTQHIPMIVRQALQSATPTTSKSKEQALAVNFHRLYATWQSHSSNIPGKPHTTPFYNDPAFTFSTHVMLTTVTSCSTNNTDQHSQSPHWPIPIFTNTRLKSSQSMTTIYSVS